MDDKLIQDLLKRLRPPHTLAVTHVMNDNRSSPFRRSSASMYMYYCQRKPKNRKGVGLGTTLHRRIVVKGGGGGGDTGSAKGGG